MKKIFIFLFISLFLLYTNLFAQEGSEGIQMWFEEEDGSPSIIVWKTKVTNDTLTANADNTASLTTGGGAGSGDVTSVGDGLTGAVLDGSATGGTYISFYDPQGAYKIQIGNTAGAVTLTLPVDDGGANEILSTNGAGVLDWVADAGGAETNSLETVCTGIATTEIPIGTAADTVVYSALSGEATMTNGGVVTLADSVAVTSWNLTTPTITTSLTTSTPTTLTAAELDRLDGLTSAIIDDDKIDTFAELDAIVADKALVNKADGAVWLGTHDFGGAVVEIPNGATVTDPAVAGQVAIDTTTGQLLWHDGTAQRVGTYEHEMKFSLEDPVAADDNIPFGNPKRAITITDVYCECDGGTSAELIISDGTNALETITCDEDGAEDDGTIANGSFTARERMEFDLGTVTGTLNWLTVTITYTLDAD